MAGPLSPWGSTTCRLSGCTVFEVEVSFGHWYSQTSTLLRCLDTERKGKSRSFPIDGTCLEASGPTRDSRSLTNSILLLETSV